MELLDPKEVLTYLNEKGFHNISAHQLKEFIYDLKRLIKHDLQLQERKEHEEELEKERLFDYLYKTSTTSFEAKRAKHKKDYIPIPLEKRKPMFIQPSCCNNKQDTKVNPKHVSSNYSKKYSDTVDACDGEVYESCQSVCSESINPELMNAKSDLSLPTKSSKSKAFIRPRLNVKKPVNKSDPVALYHAYQSDWKKFKHRMPGQTNRNSLRWNIREKMMG